MEKLTFHQRVLKVQSELKAPKNQFNSFGKYKYRNQEDILEAVKPLLAKHGLILTLSDEIVELGGFLFTEANAVLTDGTNSLAVSAQAGIDPTKKGMDISQTFGSSSSYARKYALNGLFLIDDTKDADATNRHGKDSDSLGYQAGAKDRLPDSGELFDRAKDYLKGGGSLDVIKSKYQVSKKVEQLLLS
jgi:hypothetical protein